MRSVVMRSWRLWICACACAAFVAGDALGQTSQLNTISYGARAGINVTISLSRQAHAETETCYVRTPRGDTYTLNEADIEGVTAYPNTTNFVACRVVIGPMEASLLGTWTLCGERKEGDNIIERCQPGHIAWGKLTARECFRGYSAS